MNAQGFYDQMASQYHLIASNWDEAVQKQGRILSELLLKKFATPQGGKVLDASCGIGTQAIGLSLNGFDVLGSDISGEEIKRAQIEAARLNSNAQFQVADMRTMIGVPDGFDLVSAFDNAVAHLSPQNELLEAVIAMKKKLRKDGVLLVSLRDYSIVRKERPSGMLPRLISDEHGERVYFQTWNWSSEGDSYDMKLFLLNKLENDWRSVPIETRMFAHLPEDILKVFDQAGLSETQILSPAESGYYQPIVAGRKS